MFYVGQKVVSIADWRQRSHCPHLPTKNSIYTIREIEHRDPEKLGLRFFEFSNPDHDYPYGCAEPSFSARWFRPLLEKKTDISIFKKLLVPNEREKERA